MKTNFLLIKFRLSIFSMILFLVSSPIHGKDDKTVFSFGVVPQQSATKITRLWTPIIDYLSSKSGYKLEISTANNIPEFERRLAAGLYDFAYMNPYHFTVFHDNPGYQAIARQKNKSIRGIIVVRKDSPIKTLEDLMGETLAFPSPAAFAASILTRGNLMEVGIDFNPVYVSSHDSVYLAVSRGFYPAGGGVVRTLNNADERIREQLRVLWKSVPYTSHAIAALVHTSSTVVDAVLTAMLEMRKDPQGQQLLNTISFYQGFEPAQNGDWDDVRSLSINGLNSKEN